MRCQTLLLVWEPVTCVLLDIINIVLWSIDSCQNGVSAEQSQMTVSRSQLSIPRGHVFFLKFSADQLAFNRSQAQDNVSQSYGSLLKLSIDLWISLQWFQVARLK